MSKKFVLYRLYREPVDKELMKKASKEKRVIGKVVGAGAWKEDGEWVLENMTFYAIAEKPFKEEDWIAGIDMSRKSLDSRAISNLKPFIGRRVEYERIYDWDIHDFRGMHPMEKTIYHTYALRQTGTYADGTPFEYYLTMVLGEKEGRISYYDANMVSRDYNKHHKVGK